MNSRVKELESLIIKHKALYYEGHPEISDYEYDKLEDELKKLDANNAVLNLVGAETKSGNKIKHQTKMLSLEKVYEVNLLEKWIDSNEVVSTLKIDGVSCSIVYEDKKFKLAKTRGDGFEGEDITSKAVWISDIPRNIKQQGMVEIRGELYCEESKFFALSEKMLSLGLEKPTSQRNIVAGLVGRKDHIELSRYLSFKAFDVITDSKIFSKEIDKSHFLKENQFDTPPIILHKNIKTVKETIKEAQEFMSSGEYQIDGLVFTYNDIALQNKLGETSHHPRYKIAFKFPAEAKVTKIKKIEWSVSRNGILTPVALVEPIELSGAMVSRVTLHNYGMVKIHELKSGDEIEIVRSGEVIPKFLSVKKSSKNVLEIPTHCPSCEGPVKIIDIRIFCDNEKCPVRVRETILNFVKKIGIDDLNEKRIEEMLSKGLIRDIDDLFKIRKEDLLILDKTKEKLAEKIFQNISNKKKIPIINFLSSLGIEGGGYNKCEKIVHAGYESIEKVMSMKLEDLIAIDGFAQKSASDFMRSFEEKKSLVKKLIKIGVEVLPEIKAESPITNLKICITGALTEKRSVIEERIRKNGGIVVSSVSKNTDMLVTNEQTSDSSKFKKAKELGIKIVNENELKEMFAQ
ncbi:MAG: NAD-dependent DNA ligase LigA [Bdellovibrio sp.]